jgi:hypothetical protein
MNATQEATRTLNALEPTHRAILVDCMGGNTEDIGRLAPYGITELDGPRLVLNSIGKAAGFLALLG